MGPPPDEGAPKKGSGWTGRGSPLLVGSSYTRYEKSATVNRSRPQERWAVDDRRYPGDPIWSSEVAKRHMTCAEKVGTPELLASLALGEISSCPFPPGEIDELKLGVINFLQTVNFSLGRHPRGSKRCRH